MLHEFPCPHCPGTIFVLPGRREKAVCPHCLNVAMIPTAAQFPKSFLDWKLDSTTPHPYPVRRQAFGPHARSAEPPGCLAWAAGLFVAVAVIAGTWPFSLWLIIAGLAIYLALATKARRSIRSVFRDSELSPSLEHARRKTIRITLVIVTIYTFICAVSSQDSNLLPWWFLAGALWWVVCHLSVLELAKAKPKRKLASALLQNVREFVLVATVVFGVYAVAALFIGHLPLDRMTLFQLRRWEEDISHIHEFLKALKFSALQLFILFVALVSLRIVDRRFGHNTAMVERAGKWIRLSLTWIERLSLAFLVAASLTFLGTEAVGLPAKISAQIKDANQQYLELQREVRAQSDTAIRQEVLKKAWKERPPTIKAEMNVSQALIFARGEYKALQDNVRSRLKLESAPVDAVDIPPPPSTTVDLRQPETWSAPGFVGPEQIQKVLSEARASSQLPNEVAERDDETPEDELLSKTLNELSPVERLTDSVATLATLKEHYPVFGEFIATCSSAFGEAALTRLRDIAVVKSLHAKFLSPSRPLPELIRQEAVTGVQATKFDWSSYSTAWSGRLNADIGHRRQRLEIAKQKLLASAARTQTAQVARYEHSIREKDGLLDRLSTALHSTSIREDAHRIAQESRQLSELSKTWPAAGKATPTQIAAFKSSVRSADFHVHDDIRWESWGRPLWGLDPADPLSAMGSLIRRCDNLIRDIVGRSLSWPQNDSVRRALGPKFADYETQWKALVEAREEARKEEIERREKIRQQQIIEHEKEMQRQREEEYRREQMEREHDRVEL